MTVPEDPDYGHATAPKWVVWLALVGLVLIAAGTVLFSLGILLIGLGFLCAMFAVLLREPEPERRPAPAPSASAGPAPSLHARPFATPLPSGPRQG